MTNNTTNKPANNKSALVINERYLKAAGIELSNADNAAAEARAALLKASGGKGYIPQNSASDTVLKIMDYVRRENDAGEQSKRQVSIGLATVDISAGYRAANDANGNPYTSMLAFSMDVLPNLSKSTVASYLSVGRNIYVPALRGEFGAASGAILALPPSTLDALKSNLSNPATREDTIAVVKAAAGNKKTKITQALAKKIAGVVRDKSKLDTPPAMTASDMLKAAQGDTEQLAKITGNDKASKPAGATSNGGNAESKEAANREAYNIVLSTLKGYIAVTRGDAGYTLTTGDDVNTAALRGFLRKAMLSDDNTARAVCRALASMIDT